MRTDLALAALASAAVPGMKPVAVAGIGPGDDARASELQSALVEDATGRRWVVRAPLTPVAGARLQRNDELVRQLARHVPFKVPAAVGYAPVGKDGSAAVYPHVEGSPLDLRRLPAGPGLASAVGRALAAVHNIPRAVFEEQDVPVFDASGARQRAIAEVDRAAETGRVPTGLLARWEEAFEAAPLWQFATTPVHGSFTGASVVVAFTDEDDAATGRVVAVTDWDEAMVGDPAVDLAELWSRSSRQAWVAVLESYTLARAHRPDPYLQARAQLVAELRSLRGLARAVADGNEDEVRRCVEALRRVDRLTEADDSLVPATARPSGSRPTGHTGTVTPVAAQDLGQPEPAGDIGEGTSPDVSREDLSADVAQTDDAMTGEGGETGSSTAVPGWASEADLTMEVPPPSVTETGPSGTASATGSAGARGLAGTPGDLGVTPDDDATVQIDVGAHAAPRDATDEAFRSWTGHVSADRPQGDAVPGEPLGERTADAEDGDDAMAAGAHRGGPGAGDVRADDARPDEVEHEGSGTGPRTAAGPLGHGGADGKAHPLLDDHAQNLEDGEPGDKELRDGEPGDEELQDEERLHELYGMPARDQDAEDR